MRNAKLFFWGLLFSSSLLTGCITELDDGEKSEAKTELKSFLDGYNEEENKKVSNAEATDKNYIDKTEVTANAALGSARIGGEIAIASLSNRRRAYAARSQQLRPNKRAIETLNTDSFKVSFIDGSGQKISVDISQLTIHLHQPSNDNPQFIIEGVTDGINYIIDIIVNFDGNVLDLKTVALVPLGEDKSEKAIVDPISTVIAKAVQEKVQNGYFETGGDTFSQTYIRDLHHTMVAIVNEVIASNPDVTHTSFENAIISPDGIDSLVGKLLSVQEIEDGLNTLENAALSDTFTVPLTVSDIDTAREIISDLLNQGDQDSSDNAPLFFINFFADRYLAGDLKNIEQLSTAIFLDLEFDSSHENATQYNEEDALQSFIIQLFDIYARVDAINLLEKQSKLSASEAHELSFLNQSLSNIPNQLLGIFPHSDKDQWASLSGSNQFTVPQTFGFIFYTLNIYLKDLTTSQLVNGQLEESLGVTFNPNNLLLLYGYDPVNAEQQAQYSNIDINWLDLHPGRTWFADADGGQGSEIDILSLSTCIDTYPIENYTINNVSLTYPKQDGNTGLINLVRQSELQTQLATNDATSASDGNDDTCYILDPWLQSEILALSGNPEYGDASQGFINYDIIWRDLLASGAVISDFASGEYTLNVNYNQLNVTGTQTLTMSFNKRVVTGLDNLYPQFISPNGLPPLPGTNASPEEHDAYSLAINSFEITTFANADSVFFSWLPPHLLSQTSLPEGVMAVYHLDVGREICQFNEELQYQECQWQRIFSSQENNDQIFNTQYEVPDSVKVNLLPLALSDSPYQANLNIEFVDELSGEFVGSGGWAQAPFRIGEVLNLDSTFTLQGRIFNAPDNSFINPQTAQPYPISHYKVAAIEENCVEDTSAAAQTYTYTDELGNEVTDSYFPWTCNITTLEVSPLTISADGNEYTYSLSPTLREMMNGSQDRWIDIRLFIDINNDNTVQQSSPDNSLPGEPMFWAEGFINFNSWGGVLRLTRDVCDFDNQNCVYTETVVSPGSNYEGPNFNINPLFDNIDENATFTLTGQVLNAPDLNIINPQNGQPFPISDYKVAIIKENCFEDTSVPAQTSTYTDEFGNEVTDTYFPWVCDTQTLDISDLTTSIDGHSYSLSPTFSQMVINDPNSWLDIRLFIDINNDGLIQPPSEENNTQGEPMLWSLQYVSFSSFDGQLHIVREECDFDGSNCNYPEEVINPQEQYLGPDFDLTLN